MEPFPNLTQAGVGDCRSMLRKESGPVAEPFTEFWAKGTGVSKIGNRSRSPFSVRCSALRSEALDRSIGLL